jgi:ABC-type transporter Mla subunit MlaD
VRVTRLVAVALSAAVLSGCFAESGLRDEFREATRALDDLIQKLDDQDPIREAADRARDTVDEAQGALEAYRENPGAETRQALENAERRMNETRSVLSRLLERAPEGLRRALGEVVDALEEIRKEIRRELED